MTETVNFLTSAAVWMLLLAATVATEHPMAVFALVVVSLIVVLLLLFRMLRKSDQKGDAEDMRKRKLAQLKDKYADRLHDALLDDLVNGEITGKQYKEFLHAFGQQLPRLQTKSYRKDKVWWRVKMATAAMRLAMRNITPGKIPGPKPAEKVEHTPEVVVELGEKFLARRTKVKAAA